MPSRSTVILAFLAVAACGDDGGGTSSGGGGPGGGSTTAASTATATASSTSVVASSSGAGGDGGVASSDGGGGTGQGGAGGEGGAGGAPSCIPEGDVLPVLEEPPELLSETGLYAALPDFELGPDIQPFDVRFPLWSDGADKSRWVYLPECTTIDTADMDHWVLPVGARFYKEFAIDGVRLETRVIHRWGTGPDDFWFATYVWNDAETEALRETDGVVDVKDTTHDVPSEQLCFGCHGKLPEHIIGFSAVQLGHDDLPLTLDDLAAQGWLTTEAPEIALVEDDPTALAALGVLHGSCSHCHNDTPSGVFFIEPFSMRLEVDDVDVEDTRTFQTAVDVGSSFGGADFRISAGDTAESCVSVRMASREPSVQMPPVATEFVDTEGLSAVNAWIVALGQ